MDPADPAFHDGRTLAAAVYQVSRPFLCATVRMGKVLQPIPSPHLLLWLVQTFHLQRLPRYDPGKDHLPSMLRYNQIAEALRIIHKQRIAFSG